MQYGPTNARNLVPGKTYKWCTCGLTKTEPWCDDEGHKGTKFAPLKWVCPEVPQTLYPICSCKYTERPPYCDGSHWDLPLRVARRMHGCQEDHTQVRKLCDQCGWTPGTVIPELPDWCKEEDAAAATTEKSKS